VKGRSPARSRTGSAGWWPPKGTLFLDEIGGLPPMKEIEANDFNLNVSRYISTAEADAPIDLAETHRKLEEMVDRSARRRRSTTSF